MTRVAILHHDPGAPQRGDRDDAVDEHAQWRCGFRDGLKLNVPDNSRKPPSTAKAVHIFLWTERPNLLSVLTMREKLFPSGSADRTGRGILAVLMAVISHLRTPHLGLGELLYVVMLRVVLDEGIGDIDQRVINVRVFWCIGVGRVERRVVGHRRILHCRVR